MLNKIILSALKNRLLVICVALIIAFAGFWQAGQMPVDIFPDLNRPQVVILTEAPGMTTEDVENLISRPIEQMLNGATGVENVRSQSGLGLSAITVQFGWGTDIYRNRQIVQENLQSIKELLPANVHLQMMPISSIMGQIQMISFSSRSGKTSIEKLRDLVDNDIRYRLLGIPGVAKVISIGGSPRQLQIYCNPDKMRQLNISIQEVEKAIQNRNLTSSGGYLNIGNQAPVITVDGLIKSGNDLNDTVVAIHDDRSVTLSEIATISFGSASNKIGEAGVNGKPAVLITVMKQPETDTVQLSNAIEKSLQELSKSYNDDIEINTAIFKQADFITRAIDNVIEAVRDGSIMVVIILVLFLMNLRISFITLTAIPLSIAVTALIFALFDVGINTMTLGGIAVAVGALVDDAIVDVENVYRRLRQNQLLNDSEKLPVLTIIYQASSEVRKPILIGTLLVIVVYLPLFFLSGMEGRLFAPIGIAYIISITASLLVALSVTPVLCYYLLPASIAKEASQKDTFLVRTLKGIAEKVIRTSIQLRWFIIAGTTILFFVSVYLISLLGTQFLPEFNEGSVQVNMVLPPETSLLKTDQLGKILETELMKINGIAFVGRRSGRAYGDEHAEGVNKNEVFITFTEDMHKSREEILHEIRTRLEARFPGIAISSEQPLAHLISHMLSGVYAQVAIKIRGNDLAVLQQSAKSLYAKLKPIDGVTDLNIEQQVLTPQIKVIPNNEAMKRYGVTVSDIASVVSLSFAGTEVSTMIDGSYKYPIIMMLDEKFRQSTEDIENLLINNVEGQMIRLKDVAQVKMVKSYNMIQHDNSSRRMVISHNISGRALGDVVQDINKELEVMRQTLPAGYTISLEGQYEAQQNAKNKIIILSIFSALLMLIILYTHFQSMSLSLQIMASIPMAFIGAAIYLYIDNQIISIATLVGIISLGGIAARNAILLIDHYLHLILHEKREFSIETLIAAGQERLVPVFMTALTSGIALVPIAMNGHDPGKEILYPVATVIIGGLISSTLLDFILTPALFWVLGKKTITKLQQKEHII